MTMISIVEATPLGFHPAVLAGPEHRIEHVEDAALAAWFRDCEEADFHWESRISERHLGAYESLDDDEYDLERIAIIGWIDGLWHVSICVVDGDGAVHHMLGCKRFASAWDAEGAFADAV